MACAARRSIIWNVRKCDGFLARGCQSLKSIETKVCFSTSSPTEGSISRGRQDDTEQKEQQQTLEELTPGNSSKMEFPKDFSERYPDFLPDRVFERRNPLRGILERRDMLNRRLHIDIPVFYVGSIVAVTQSDQYAPGRKSRFLGICIFRDKSGLKHHFILRNSIDGIGIEVMYELYHPLIQKIEVIKLEKHVDNDLRYLRDAPSEHSTFPMDMEPVPRAPDASVNVNKTKVKLKPPPWTSRWEMHDLNGVHEDFWNLVTPWYKSKFQRSKLRRNTEYDVIADYRDTIPLEDQQKIYEEMVDYESDHMSELRQKKRPRMFRFKERTEES